MHGIKSSWEKGSSPLGFGDPVSTTLERTLALDPEERPMTFYFRKTIEVADAPTSGDAFDLVASIQYDDGFCLFLNGKEVLRAGLPKGEIDSETPAKNRGSKESESRYIQFQLEPTDIKDGNNLLAVELHQANPSSSDLRFSMKLEFVKK